MDCLCRQNHPAHFLLIGEAIRTVENSHGNRSAATKEWRFATAGRGEVSQNTPILTMVVTARRAVRGGFGETALPERSSPFVSAFPRLAMIEAKYRKT